MFIPPKLQPGDEIRVVALARSLSLIGEENTRLAQEKLEAQGFKVSYGKHCWEMDDFHSSSVDSRIEDFHDAIQDQGVKAILTVVGGFNTNQLLDFIDYDLVRKNPKITCGFSDITAVCNAITQVTGVVTYSGPHFSTWAMELGFEYNLEYFQKCLISETPFEVAHSKTWSDDPWYMDQQARDFIEDDQYWVLNEGSAAGKLIGGHVRCLASLQGTRFMPSLDGAILFLEEDFETNAPLFDRLLQSLIHQRDFSGVRGIVIGRFQKESHVSRNLLAQIIKSKKELDGIPVIANADFGHTNPLMTFPIGGSVEIKADGEGVGIRIVNH